MNPKKDFIKNIKSILKCIRTERSDPFYSNVAPGLAYYFLLSIAPIMIILSYVAGLFFSSSQVIITAINEYLPKEISNIVLSFLSNGSSSAGIIAAVVVFVSTLYLASKGIYALIKVADYASDNFETVQKISGAKTFILRHVKAIVLTFMMVLMIVIALLFMVFGKLGLDLAAEYIELPRVTAFLYSSYRVLTYPIAMVSIFLILMLFYSRMPTKRLPYKEVIPGAILGTAGLVLTSSGYSIYLTYFFNSNAVYGALSSVVILLLWFYLISHVLVLSIIVNGAFKKVYKK